MDQNLAQIDVPPLADAEQLRLASGGILPWHETEPCCEVSPLTESSSVADSRDNGCCHDRSDAWDLTDASATRVCSGNLPRRDPDESDQQFHERLRSYLEQHLRDMSMSGFVIFDNANHYEIELPKSRADAPKEQTP